ncbi:MAG: transcriptional repressor [Parcubacteria group bacterium]
MLEIDGIFEKIKSDGHRLTKIRKAMIGILFADKCLLSASEIRARLSASGLAADRTTVYRELGFLLGKNIIKEIRIADRKTYYEIVSPEHHHHLVCTKCNRVQEIAMGNHLKRQEDRIYRNEKFKVLAHSLEFYGLCRNCR